MMDDKNKFEEERERLMNVKEQFPSPNFSYREKDIEAIEDEEVEDAVDEINPDENSMNSRG